MRYLGNKESLIGEILHLISEKGIFGGNLVFFDAFCGMGAVSDAVKIAYKEIIINDILSCCTTYTNGRLFANSCTFDTLGFNPFEYLNTNKNNIEGFFYHNYSPAHSQRMYFTSENAARIDYYRQQIEEWYCEHCISYQEYQYLLACLLEAVSSVSNTAGVYGAFLKHWDARALKEIQIVPLHVKQGIPQNVIFYNKRIEEIIADVNCDVLYLDPPYTQNQYGTQYHLLETLILNDNPPKISAVTGSRPTTPMRSNWSKPYDVQILFEKIIAETKAKHIILSYNNDGFLTPGFIESTLKRFGIEQTYECTSIEYKKYNNFKSKGDSNHCEYLFYIEKKPQSEIVVQSPLNYTGSKTKMVPFIKKKLPHKHISTFVDLFGGGFNVGINIEADKIVYNDINPFVKDLIKSFSLDTRKYLAYINQMIAEYNLAPDYKDGYLKLRDVYNSTLVENRDPRMLYTLILYGFQQQIRFNSNYDFNNPCGSRWFNDCLQSKFITFARYLKNKKVVYTNYSFEKLLDDIDSDTFVYADPPYRATIGVYNDGKRGFEGWTLEHEQKLCNFLDIIHYKGTKFMLSYVLQVDDFYNFEIMEWVNNNRYQIIEVETTQGRYNDRKEVLITNYAI